VRNQILINITKHYIRTFRLNFKPSSASHKIYVEFGTQRNCCTTIHMDQRVGLRESETTFLGVVLFISVNQLITLLCNNHVSIMLKFYFSYKESLTHEVRKRRHNGRNILYAFISDRNYLKLV